MASHLRKHQNGFTLVELLVVFLIIGVLTAILMPTLGKARRQARRAKCMSNLWQIGEAVHMFIGERGKFAAGRRDVREVPPWRWLFFWHIYDPITHPIESADPSTVRQLRWFTTNPDGSVSPNYRVQGIGMLFPYYLGNVDVVYCPESDLWTPANAWPAQDLNYYITYHSREGGWRLPNGSVGYRVYPLIFRGYAHAAFLSCASWRGYCAHDYGWNVWFLDGSANWYPDDDVIKTLGDEEWFDKGRNAVPAGRPSVWQHFDRWKRRAR